MADMAAVHEAWQQFQVQADEVGNTILRFFHEAGFEDRPIDRTAHFPVTSFHEVIAVVCAYVSFVFIASLWQLSPLGMKLDLYPVRFIYNLFQVILCSYMCVESLMLALRNNYTGIVCQPFNVEQPVFAELQWLFYASKILDFFDTVFIISGKKWKQLSVLHVYHHAATFVVSWINTRVGYDSDIFLTILLNAFIHSIMYTYYFVSMHTKEIWWKRFLTIAQMTQFCVMLFQGTTMLTKNCGQFPVRVGQMYLVYVGSLLALFLHFFFTSGSKPRTAGGKGKGGKKKSA